MADGDIEIGEDIVRLRPGDGPRGRLCGGGALPNRLWPHGLPGGHQGALSRRAVATLRQACPGLCQAARPGLVWLDVSLQSAEKGAKLF